jgi:hypothetical protein
MLTVSQLHGFNALPDAGTVPSSAGNPDHAWRFYGLPAGMDDAVASADFTAYGTPSTQAGIANNCVSFANPAVYLLENTAIGAGEFTVSCWVKMDIGTATNTVFAPLTITEDGSTEYMEIYFQYKSNTGRWAPSLGWNSLATPFSGADVENDEWCFVALSLDSSQDVVGQVNLNSMTHADPMIGNGDEIQVNTNTGAIIGGTPTMYVDEMYCWSSALTAEQKAWLYNGGAGRFVNGFGQF